MNHETTRAEVAHGDNENFHFHRAATAWFTIGGHLEQREATMFSAIPAELGWQKPVFVSKAVLARDAPLDPDKTQRTNGT